MLSDLNEKNRGRGSYSTKRSKVSMRQEINAKFITAVQDGSAAAGRINERNVKSDDGYALNARKKHANFSGKINSLFCSFIFSASVC